MINSRLTSVANLKLNLKFFSRVIFKGCQSLIYFKSNQTVKVEIVVMSVADRETISEESEDDGAGESREEMIYRRKYQMLLERCEVLQQDNERLVHRIQQVFKYTRQVRKERKYLMDKLDNYGDNWRQGITQYYYESSQSNKPSNKLKYHSRNSNSEKRVKKSTSSAKKYVKDKSDLDLPVRKNLKESISKGSFKNLSNYGFM